MKPVTYHFEYSSKSTYDGTRKAIWLNNVSKETYRDQVTGRERDWELEGPPLESYPNITAEANLNRWLELMDVPHGDYLLYVSFGEDKVLVQAWSIQVKRPLGDPDRLGKHF